MRQSPQRGSRVPASPALSQCPLRLAQWVDFSSDLNCGVERPARQPVWIFSLLPRVSKLTTFSCENKLTSLQPVFPHFCPWFLYSLWLPDSPGSEAHLVAGTPCCLQPPLGLLRDKGNSIRLYSSGSAPWNGILFKHHIWGRKRNLSLFFLDCVFQQQDAQ